MVNEMTYEIQRANKHQIKDILIEAQECLKLDNRQYTDFILMTEHDNETEITRFQGVELIQYERVDSVELLYDITKFFTNKEHRRKLMLAKRRHQSKMRNRQRRFDDSFTKKNLRVSVSNDAYSNLVAFKNQNSLRSNEQVIEQLLNNL